MWMRANDVLVGVVTGAFSAVVAALFEASIVTARFLSIGDRTVPLGSKLAWIVLGGAVIGGLVGFFVVAFVKPRPQPR